MPKRPPLRVLSASVDPGLNHARALLLERYGLDVTTSESTEHALQQIHSAPFDVLIFGSTLPRDTCWELARPFRSRNAQGRIIEIVPSEWTAPKNQPDAVVASSDEAQRLVTIIYEQVGGSA